VASSITVIRDECVLYPDFIQSSVGYQLFQILQKDVPWEQKALRLFDQSFRSPRLTSWYADDGASYRYSGVSLTPQPWPDSLVDIRDQVRSFTNQMFNSVLLNYYRGGYDGMGKHSDDERELGRKPVIASLSLGSTRRFILHPKPGNKNKSCMLNLPHGSLLVMTGNCQKNWKHSVPKTKSAVGPRINLTFRNIL
jgi:alkylated DNA repair dioxygenase AlkB